MLCASCGKTQDCAPAKSAAVDALEEALRNVVKTKQDARQGRPYPRRIDDLQRQFDQDVEIVDLALDCAQLAKASAPELVPIQSALSTLKSLEPPMPIGDALQPVISLYDANLGLLSGPSPKIEAWCRSMREAISKVKQDTPPLWARAKSALETERAAADAKLDAIRARETTIRDWLTAVEAGKPVTAGSDELRAPLAAYQDACHFK